MKNGLLIRTFETASGDDILTGLHDPDELYGHQARMATIVRSPQDTA